MVNDWLKQGNQLDFGTINLINVSICSNDGFMGRAKKYSMWVLMFNILSQYCISNILEQVLYIVT